MGVLLATGFDADLKDALVEAIQKEKATAAIIALKVGGADDAAGRRHGADRALAGSPSVLFDAVAVLTGPEGDKALSNDPDSVGFLMDACRHLKAIGLTGASRLAEKTQIAGAVGVVALTSSKEIATFIKLARNGKVWDREIE